jgi:hypothetical protein
MAIRQRTSVVTGGLLLMIAGPARAQESRFPPPPLFAPQAPTSKPYVVDWHAPPAAEPAAAPKPSIVCGMTVVRADPKVDPKIRVAPKEDGVKYALKVAEPTVCAAREPTHR